MGKGLTRWGLLIRWLCASLNLRLHRLLFVAAVAIWATVACSAHAQDIQTTIPAGARTLAPVLADRQGTLWPRAPQPYTLAGLVEQESCITLAHSKCWNPRAELKTSREYGFGLGQITVAYRADGSVRFNKFEELRAEFPSLRNWVWADRYRADYQLTAVVEMVRTIFGRFAQIPRSGDRWAFTLSSYNGGVAAALQDQRLCANTAGCDPSRWWANVERYSLKSRMPQPAYGGRSFFEINRSYPRKVLVERRGKYQDFWSPR